MKFKLSILTLLLVIMFTSTASASSTPTVKYNGDEINLGYLVRNYDGSLYLPVRALVENTLGGEVKYHPESDPIIEVVTDKLNVKFVVSSTNHKIYNGNTLVSLRHLAEILDLGISYDSETHTVLINSKDNVDYINANSDEISVKDINVPNESKFREYMNSQPAYTEAPEFIRERGEIIYRLNNTPYYVGYLNGGKVQCRPEMDTEENECTTLILYTEDMQSKQRHISLLLDLIGLEYTEDEIWEIDKAMAEESVASSKIVSTKVLYEGKNIEVIYNPGLSKMHQNRVSDGKGNAKSLLGTVMRTRMSELYVTVPSKYYK